VAVLSYNCVGPEACWATTGRAGCAYVRVATADGTPVAPAAALVEADRGSLKQMMDDVAAARRDADFVVVALHKGLVHVPVRLAPYERPVAHAAIEAGADLVIAHHAHILRGIEMHRGCPIFHGLGNGVVVTRALSPAQDHPARAAWARRRRELFGFEPLPDYPLYPFHPDARNAMLADVRVAPDGRVSAGFRPCWVEPGGMTVPCERDGRGTEVADYVARISAEAGFATHFTWEGERVVCA
jgi:poly-gamma-glutamate synthesis protein (capsule biosynthesis protein)